MRVKRYKISEGRAGVVFETDSPIRRSTEWAGCMLVSGDDNGFISKDIDGPQPNVYFHVGYLPKGGDTEGKEDGPFFLVKDDQVWICVDRDMKMAKGEVYMGRHRARVLSFARRAARILHAT